MNPPLAYKDLVDIPVIDCGETLLPVTQSLPNVLFEPINQDMDLYPHRGMILRQGAIRALGEAARALSHTHPTAQLKVVYCYRHPQVQQRYFDTVAERIREANPEVSDRELCSQVHQFIASPDVAGHPTGGAVDVSIVRGHTELDMGSPLWDLSPVDLIPTFSPRISDQARAHRMLLRNAMMSAGFAPFDGEWWHFSYGDREWAAYYKKSHAIYNQVALAAEK